MSSNSAKQLTELGQSIWYDNISREIIENGELKRLISEWSVRGITSNPTIFDNAISKSTTYDEKISSLAKAGTSADEIFVEVAIADIADAADMLRPIYDESNGDDGFVSIEVSPLLAADTEGTVAEARRLYKKLNRPNIMVKVPGTPEGIPAVKTLLSEGISVNITLLFSVENYVEVAKTYLEALSERANAGETIDKVRSVASFFVSRVDTIVDDAINALIESASDEATIEKAKSLLGKFGVANSKLAYGEFEKLFSSKEFAPLKEKGAAVQRPLWASTGTKNPEYSDVIYVEELIGPDTVNTMPHKTLEAFVDHGTAARTIDTGLEEAQAVRDGLLELGIDLSDLMSQLQSEGVTKFADSFKALNESIQGKMK